MKNRIQESISVLSYPKEFNGIKLSFLQDESTEEYNNYERIPSWFWFGPTYEKVPINKIYRKRLCSSLLDFNHKDLCSIETFHIPNEECKCKFCKGSCSHFHERYCPEMIQCRENTLLLLFPSDVEQRMSNFRCRCQQQFDKD